MGYYAPGGGGGGGGAIPVQAFGCTKPWSQSAAAPGPGANWAQLYLIDTLVGQATVSNIVFAVGTASGNIDVGIYSLNAAGTIFTRLGSSGSTPCPAAGNAILPMTSSVILNPAQGPFYIAIALDNATATLFSGLGSANLNNSPLGNAIMSWREPSALPLPPTLTVSAGALASSFWCTAAK